jgi:hypothetical protein
MKRQRSSKDHRSSDLRLKVLCELEMVIRGEVRASNPIEEQLRQCPEAYDVGRVVERLCQEIMQDHRGGSPVMPVAGIIVPPFG